MEKKVVLALDVGTTTIRCCIFNKDGKLQGTCKDSVPVLYPKPGYVEINPEELFNVVISIISTTLKTFNYSADEVNSLGIATLRGSFTIWSRKTGKPFHNIITWKDLRANDVVQSLNCSVTLKALNVGSWVLHLLTRKNRFLGGRVLKFMNGQVTPRLLWAIKNIPQLSKAIEEEDALFGCVDTWLVYMLTNKGQYITDISSISGTALYDPYDQNYAFKIMSFFGIPNKLKLPEIKPSRYDFGRTDKTQFGAMIPIASLVSDQGASIYGCGCSSKGMVRLTLGTGTFLSYNTLNLPHASISGLYPTAAYQESGKKVFVAEGSSTDTGPILDWCKRLGLFDDYKEITTIIQSVEDSDGVFFIPAFSGLQVFGHQKCASLKGKSAE